MLSTGLVLLTLLASASEDMGSGSGIAFAAELMVPVNDGFGAKDLGYGFAVGYWREWSYVAVQPRFAFDFGPGESDARYMNMAWDFAVFALPLRGPVTPIIGGGIGARYLSVKGPSLEGTVGSVIQASYREQSSVSGLGFGLLGRAGVLFFRGSPTHLTLTADYTVGFFDAFETPQALVISLGLST